MIQKDDIHTYQTGRVFFVHWNGQEHTAHLAPSQISAAASGCGARYLVLDATQAPYANSDDLRWLLSLRDALAACGKVMRIAAKPGSNIRRNVSLMKLDLDVYDSVQNAWRTPWRKARQ